MIDPGLKNKVVLITGANHSIGAATARTLAAQGARVFITYLRLPPLGTPSEQAKGGDTHTRGLALYNLRNQDRTESRWRNEGQAFLEGRIASCTASSASAGPPNAAAV